MNVNSKQVVSLELQEEDAINLLRLCNTVNMEDYYEDMQEFIETLKNNLACFVSCD